MSLIQISLLPCVWAWFTTPYVFDVVRSPTQHTYPSPSSWSLLHVSSLPPVFWYAANNSQDYPQDILSVRLHPPSTFAGESFRSTIVSNSATIIFPFSAVVELFALNRCCCCCSLPTIAAAVHVSSFCTVPHCEVVTRLFSCSFRSLSRAGAFPIIRFAATVRVFSVADAVRQPPVNESWSLGRWAGPNAVGQQSNCGDFRTTVVDPSTSRSDPASAS